MAYERTSGLVVNTQYGPRTNGGGQGVHKTEGVLNEYVIDGASQGLPFLMPRGGGVFVSKIDLTYAKGTVSALTVGGVSILGATDSSPVYLPSTNTGEVVATGLTGGRIIVTFKKEAGYEADLIPAFPYYGPAVTGVTVAPSTLALTVGQVKSLTATAAPSTASQEVFWTSSDATKAKVSQTGQVTGVAAGTATVTAYSRVDNSKLGSSAVTVS